MRPRPALVRQPPDAVLDHDDARVDDQAEVDRPQAHQAGRDPGGEHQLAAKSIESGIARATIRPPAQVPQQHQQDHDDQHAALHQVVQHRVERLVDQVGAVVERLDRHARRAGSSGARRSAP